MASLGEKLGKALLEAPLHLVPNGPPPPLPPPPDAVRRVLLVRPDERIGNLILLTPLIDAARRAWPQATLDLVVGGAMAPLMRGDPRFSRIHVFDKRALVRRPLGLIPLAHRLRRARYDLAIDASHPHHFSLTAALLTRVTGARWRLGYLSGPAHRLLNVGLTLAPGVHEHLTDVYLALLRRVAPEAENRGLSFPLAPAERAEARARLAAAGVPFDGPRLVGVHPGGRGAKRWPLENFVAAMREIAARGDARCVVFHGPGEEALIAGVPPDAALVAPRLPLRLFAAGLSLCDLVVSGDTGPMHLSAAVGTPTLALFLHGNAMVFGPRGPRDRALHRPAGLTAAEVAAAAGEMLDAGRGNVSAGGGGEPAAQRARADA